MPDNPRDSLRERITDARLNEFTGTHAHSSNPQLPTPEEAKSIQNEYTNRPPLANAIKVVRKSEWLALAESFQNLTNSTSEIHAFRCSQRWTVDSAPNPAEGEEFNSLARTAALMCRVPNRDAAIDWWLDLLRRNVPHKFNVVTTSDSSRILEKSGNISAPAFTSGEHCKRLAHLAGELEETAIGIHSGRIGFRRDRYPENPPFLFPRPQSIEGAWEYFRNQIVVMNPRGPEMVGPDRRTIEEHKKLLFNNLSDLSYNLAVHCANSIIDRGGPICDWFVTFQGDSAELEKQVKAAWTELEECQTSPRFFDTDEEDIAYPFRRVETDLLQLVGFMQEHHDSSSPTQCVKFERASEAFEYVATVGTPSSELTANLTHANLEETNLAAIQSALDSGNRILAIDLRCKLDGCKKRALYLQAFANHHWAESTKKTAYIRWRKNDPKYPPPEWAGGLMIKRLLMNRTDISPTFSPTSPT